MRKFSVLFLCMLVAMVTLTVGCSTWSDDNPVAATTTTVTPSSSITNLNIVGSSTVAASATLTVTSNTPLTSLRIAPAIKGSTISAKVTHSNGTTIFTTSALVNTSYNTLTFKSTEKTLLGKITKIDFTGYKFPASVKISFAKGSKLLGSSIITVDATTGTGKGASNASGTAVVKKPSKIQIKGKTKPKLATGKTFPKKKTTAKTIRFQTIPSGVTVDDEAGLMGYVFWKENNVVSSTTFKVYTTDGVELVYDIPVDFKDSQQYTVAIFPLNYIPDGSAKDDKMVVWKTVIGKAQISQACTGDDSCPLELLKEDGSPLDSEETARATMIEQFMDKNATITDMDAIEDKLDPAEILKLEAKIDALTEKMDPDLLDDEDLSAIDGFAGDADMLAEALADMGDVTISAEELADYADEVAFGDPTENTTPADDTGIDTATATETGTGTETHTGTDTQP